VNKEVMSVQNAGVHEVRVRSANQKKKKKASFLREPSKLESEVQLRECVSEISDHPRSLQ
jgi:hypothetical protein